MNFTKCFYVLDRTKVRNVVLPGLALLVPLIAYGQGLGAPSLERAPQIPSRATGEVEVEDRTPEMIDRFPQALIPLPRRRSFLRPPDMTDEQYRAVKDLARAVTIPKPQDPNSPSQLGVATSLIFAGARQTDNIGVGQPQWTPPDTSGAVGLTEYVETVNSFYSVYSKAGVLLKRASLNALAGYSTQPLFDPRVVYDAVWNRWVICAPAFPESASVQRFFIMVSKTSSAAGGWWVYNTNTVSFTQLGAFWDYPSLGMDQDGLIFTANVFGSGGFLGAYTFALAKGQAYNGRGQGFAVFGGLIATLMPPIVVKADINGYAWLASAPNGSGTIRLYAMRDSSRPNVTALFGPYSATNAVAYGIPPDAAQPAPCASATLDSLDNRFVQSHTQSGDRLWQVHTVNLGGFATPRYYVIGGLSTFAPNVLQTAVFYKSATSHDFNPSIAADSANNMLITWTATDPNVGTNAQVRHVGRLNSAPFSGTGGGQGVTATSGTCLTGSGVQRWGDYSQVSLDPSVPTRKFWWVNESIAAASTWWSHIGAGVVF